MNIYEKISQKIDDIGQDNSSGSSELAKRAAVALLEAITEIGDASSSSIQPLHSFMLAFAKELLQAQPKMATLFNLVNRAMLIINSHTNLAEAIAALEKYIYNFLEIVVNSSENISQLFQKTITNDSVILVHSYSSTVNKVLINAKRSGLQFEVFVTESRPILEGRKTAQLLSEEGIAVTFIVDSGVMFALQRSSMVLFGADAITSGGIVNKIGTNLIALAARNHSRPAYVLADSTKFLPTSYKLMMEELHPTDEIWPESPDKIVVLNRYFETTPLDLFDSVITEHGALQTLEVKLHLTNLGISSELCTQL